jgi:hypothetical protein
MRNREFFLETLFHYTVMISNGFLKAKKENRRAGLEKPDSDISGVVALQ